MVCLPRDRAGIDLDDERLLSIGRDVLKQEASELLRVADEMGQEIVKAARVIHCSKGRLVVIGMGKSGLIGRKIAATLASLGTPSFFLHAAEASHGDLGMVCREDVGLFISNSGKTKEVVALLPFFRRLGAPVISITGGISSPLAKNSDIVLNSSVSREADPLNLAPTSSTTVQLAIGDALAGMVTELRGLEEDDFALFHPGGALGRRLLTKVEDVMGSGDKLPVVIEHVKVSDALFEMTSKGYGATLIVDEEGKLAGIFTDGDLRRLIERCGVECLESDVSSAMTKNPVTLEAGRLAAEAVHIMEEREISVLIVAKAGKPIGIIHLHELLKAGVA
ncbi:MULTISPECIES: KpsF/GutQ family sugar-phosphate isomerase [Aminobacterium]|jgi:arabinose-5-phosphate isomerase|uniref:KpsF/GutQ family protein n=1 Tax=Aminobacterium colombiense (strain DSM 12261 / ALA-1) TaxID=572547 RepID=D5EGC8_AMICL|nr:MULTISPECIES: KpsF/GutQ family sugar-phosphate isomerase [Aminobacterium]MDD2378476.1 KpsF/GutQ family sugar-phosphate isomerase [Aminobacterium colombiense]ADE57610.1 KpsF/GutQ family protein [Aminobacterium colombiense DSM 12261]MDD3768224.1 KpsF/GutQ family sugar-phosphate isomerase [Aminobacterium colombiense]MDD4265021.1 KpsF/GutQ family sugar-phosphate isomerase [Aminobacterium colombiense]MDD4586265.1 KpsF/GutQ family sugar-phosphate isomerase [Aminobacterium colombiense]